MAEIEDAHVNVEPAVPEQAAETEQAETETGPAVPESEPGPSPVAADPKLAALYGKSSLPSFTLNGDVPVSAVVGACWPDKSPAVRAS